MMQRELIVPEGSWRSRLGLSPRRTTPTHLRFSTILNYSHTPDGKLHRWLLRDDILAILYSEAERLESKDLKVLADRIAETTAAKDQL